MIIRIIHQIYFSQFRTYATFYFYSATFGTRFELDSEHSFIATTAQKIERLQQSEESNAAMKGPGVTWDGGHNSTMIYFYNLYL